MKKFDVGSRVLFKMNGVPHRGRVTQMGQQTRRVVTDTSRRFSVPVRRLRASPDRALILETRLDKSLRSQRAYGPMMRQWLSAYNVNAVCERVHTKDAVCELIRHEGRNVATRYIHIMGHGRNVPSADTAYLRLSFERVDLYKCAEELFSGLEGKIIIFSCCEIGANLKVMRRIKEVSQAQGVIGYRIAIEDWYTNLAEALLYEHLINSKAPPQKAVARVTEALRAIGARQQDIVRKPILVCV